MKQSRKEARIKRAKRARCKHRSLGVVRLVVNKTPRHIYAQIIESGKALQSTHDKVLATVTTVSKNIRDAVGYTGNVEAAKTVGKLIAEQASSLGVSKVAFDRSGNIYHGRVRALAEAARENGLEF